MRLVAVVALACACRTSKVTPDTAPLQTPSSELPAWFGTAGTRTITGVLVDAEQRPLAGVVRLRIDVPDASIWTGIDQTTSSDGRFVFQAPRAGRYTLFATAPGVTSRVVDVDASKGDVDVTVFAFECSPQAIVVQSIGGVRLASARVVIGGTISYTDDRGMFLVCANERPLLASIHASGYAATTTKVELVDAIPSRWPVQLVRAITIPGRIFDKAGRPAAGIGVQPTFVDQVMISHGNPYNDLPLIVTSGADGTFVFHELAEMDGAASRYNGSTVAAYTARSMQGDDFYVHFGASFGAHADGELVLTREHELDHGSMTLGIDMRWRTWKLRGRVVRHGTPVPDAEVIRDEVNYSRRTLGFSGADGTVDIDMFALGQRKASTRVRIQDVRGNGREFDVVEDAPDADFELP